MKLNLNYKKTAAISGAVLAFAIINGYFMFPSLLKFMLKMNLRLKPGSQMRPLFEKIPFPLVFKVYFFNVTNPNEVMNGSKPIVHEVGPYMFDEWKDRENIVDDEKNDTITYTLKNRYIFRPDLTIGLTGEEIVTMPNLVMMGAVLAVKRDRAPMIPLVTKAMKSIFNSSTSVFMNIKVLDILFDGIPVNCAVTDFAAKTVCSAIEAEGEQVKNYNETHLAVALLKNNTVIAKFTAFRGVKNIKDMGRIVMVNDERMQSVWDGDECNQFVGTDTTIFPPFMSREEGLWSYSPEICMSLNAKFQRKSSYAGMPTSIFTLDFGDMKTQPEKHCFCNDPPDDCPPRGTVDLMPCFGTPIFGSKPHFLDAEELLENIDGLHPNRSLHDVFVNFEMFSGTPLEGYKRLQLNLDVSPVEEFDLMSQLPTTFMPLIWVEESIQLNKTYTNLLKYQLFLALKFNSFTKWLGIVGGIAGLIFSSYMIFNGESKKATITTVAAFNDNKAETDKRNLDTIKFNADDLKNDDEK